MLIICGIVYLIGAALTCAICAPFSDETDEHAIVFCGLIWPLFWVLVFLAFVFRIFHKW